MEQLPERAQRYGRALFELGGEAAPGDVGRKAGLDGSGQARARGDLERAGMVEGNKARVRLTSAGWDRFRERCRPDAGALDEALAFWPYRHRAFLDLLLSAVVARHHLTEYSALHPGFMALGGQKTGKSAMGEAACHLLGLDVVEHLVQLPEVPEGVVAGRTYQTTGGVWRYSPAPAMGRPLVIFEEYDKADAAAQKAVLPYFQGRLEQEREGERFRYRPTPVLTANPPRTGDRYGQLRVEYWRRSVVLDTGPADEQLTRTLHEGLRSFYGTAKWAGLIRLDDLAPALLEVPGNYQRLFITLPNVMTERGSELYCDPRTLELLALGRAALLGIDDEFRLLEAAVATALDYLACMESVPGLVVPDWPRQMDGIEETLRQVGGVERMEAFFARRRQELEAHRQVVRQKKVVQDVEDLGVTRRRAELVTALEEAAASIDGRRVPTHHRVRAAGIRSQLGRLRQEALNVRAVSRLGDLEGLSREPIDEAGALRALVDQEKAFQTERARQQKEQERAVREAQRRHPAGPTREQRFEWDRQLKAVVDLARDLERMHKRTATRKDESPFQILRDYRLPSGQGLLRYEAPPPPPPPPPKDPNRSALAKVGDWFADRGALAAPRSGWWISTLDSDVYFSGYPNSCTSLGLWGAQTKAVIEPALSQLYRAEDQLRNALRRKARAGRVPVRGAVRVISATGGYLALPGGLHPVA